MTFAASYWLIGLLPWAALAVLLLTGRRSRLDVPFLQLWRGPVRGPRPQARLNRPPLFIVLMLAALLLAVLAAARPRLLAGRGRASVIIIVDRGLTMSARGVSDLRFRELAREAAPAVTRSFGAQCDVEVVTIPGGEVAAASGRNWSDVVQHLAPTAADTREELAGAIAAHRGDSPIVVLTDRDVTATGVIHIAPASGINNVGIVRLAARESPKPQVMVGLRNDSNLTSAILRVATAGERVERTVTLPAAGHEADLFIDVARFGPTVRCEVDVNDDLPADNFAWLARESEWPRIEVSTPLPAELRRMTDVYGASRPAGETSPRVVIAGALADLPADAPGVVVAPQGRATTLPSTELVVADHPLTRSVRTWAAAGVAMDVRERPGWTSIVSRGDAVIVAVRDAPARQAWVGLDSGEWSRSSDFVIFWANVLDWVGQGGERFGSETVGPVEGKWELLEPPSPQAQGPQVWPGLYRRSDGLVKAFNAPAARRPGAAGSGDWRQALSDAAAGSQVGFSLAPAAILAALGCILLGVVAWKSLT